MIPDPECKTWYEYGMATASKRAHEFDQLSSEKKHELFEMITEILGEGWEERLPK